MNKDVIYPTMVIRSQEEAIELQEKEIKRLSKEVTKYDEILCERNNEIDRLNKAINEIKEKIDDYFAYDYENESMARLDTLNEINHIIVDLKEGKE